MKKSPSDSRGVLDSRTVLNWKSTFRIILRSFAKNIYILVQVCTLKYITYQLVPGTRYLLVIKYESSVRVVGVFYGEF